MIRKIKTIDRPDGTRVIIDQRGDRPVIIYDGPRFADSYRKEEIRHTNRQATFELGTAVESAISSIGITPERWVEFKGKFGLPKVCKCGDRKKWLNAVGKEFGVAAKTALSNLHDLI